MEAVCCRSAGLGDLVEGGRLSMWEERMLVVVVIVAQDKPVGKEGSSAYLLGLGEPRQLVRVVVPVVGHV